jgi:hypothetical protein
MGWLADLRKLAKGLVDLLVWCWGVAVRPSLSGRVQRTFRGPPSGSGQQGGEHRRGERHRMDVRVV